MPEGKSRKAEKALQLLNNLSFASAQSRFIQFRALRPAFTRYAGFQLFLLPQPNKPRFPIGNLSFLFPFQP
jgi:hypothetical protein